MDLPNINDRVNALSTLFNMLGSQWYQLLRSAKDNQLDDILFNRLMDAQRDDPGHVSEQAFCESGFFHILQVR